MIIPYVWLTRLLTMGESIFNSGGETSIIEGGRVFLNDVGEAVAVTLTFDAANKTIALYDGVGWSSLGVDVGSLLHIFRRGK